MRSMRPVGAAWRRCSTAANLSYKLRDSFVRKYAAKKAPFGFNGLGELVYLRTYSRNKGDAKESWVDTVERVVNGTFRMQLDWAQRNSLPWDALARSVEAEEMFDRIFNMKFLPPGRGLWAMGTALTDERKLFAALNNCAFVSTQDLRNVPSDPFCFLMDASMLGVGVGFDTKGAKSIRIHSPVRLDPNVTVIADSREGWVHSLRLLLDAFFVKGSALPQFDYSHVRPAGMPIKGFGGTSQGPDILVELHMSVSHVLVSNRNTLISETLIVDLMNIIGKCVVSGNVRRSAEIAFGDPNSDEYIALKDYSVNPHRAAYGWTSNNSVLATLGMDYGKVCDKIRLNGEPGLAWLENMQRFSRMADPADDKDHRALGGNPCLEQTLESYELCCLVETFPHHHESLEDYIRTLQSALLYAKTVTLGATHWPQTNAVMLRNRRIGTSMSGVAQFVAARGMGALHDWCNAGYAALRKHDKSLSERFAVRESVKLTSIKPSGTVSLLAGATPGLHFPESRFYIRRMRLSKGSELVAPLVASGYSVVDAVGDPRTVVVEIPVDVGQRVRTLSAVSMWEQLALAAFLQAHWADNQVSCTVTFDPETEGGHLQHAIDIYQYQLKGVSFLPRLSLGAYPQMPYEAISEEQYNALVSRISIPLGLSTVMQDGGSEVPDKFCDASGCGVDSVEANKDVP